MIGLINKQWYQHEEGTSKRIKFQCTQQISPACYGVLPALSRHYMDRYVYDIISDMKWNDDDAMI